LEFRDFLSIVTLFNPEHKVEFRRRFHRGTSQNQSTKGTQTHFARQSREKHAKKSFDPIGTAANATITAMLGLCHLSTSDTAVVSSVVAPNQEKHEVGRKKEVSYGQQGLLPRENPL